MSELEALWLGVVQGLTEFFPVSSSGHLVVFQTVLGVHLEDLVFDVAVHLATVVAILLFYRRRVGELALGVLRFDADALRYASKLALATLPAVIVGFTARDLITAQFSSPMLVAALLCLTGGVVFTTRFTRNEDGAREPGWWAALWIGCAQAFAILPGISRSGSTVAAALALGIAPAAAAEFSFLLGVIAISGAAVLVLPDLRHASPDALAAIGIGGVAALASGLLALWLFVRMLRTNTFHWFAAWALLAGVGFAAWQLG